jgi:hypothetical protein
VQSTTPTTIVMNQGAGSAGVQSGDLIVLGPTPGSSVAVQPSSFYPPFGYIFTPTKLVISGFSVPRRPLCVSLIYQAGYAAVPYEIAQACIELVATRYKLERPDNLGAALDFAVEPFEGVGAPAHNCAFDYHQRIAIPPLPPDE